MKKIKIGVDEAGRGPWLGPVVACAMAFNKDNIPCKEFLEQINDSKKITEKMRHKLFEELIELSIGDNPGIYFGVGVVDNFVIDDINIKQANKEAMRRALIEIMRKVENGFKPFLTRRGGVDVFIDGNDNYKFDELEKKPIYIVGGDAKVLEIGAASIIAKVFRDNLINTYSLLYPDLYLQNHKGYGTKKHRDYLNDKSKVTGIHRVSYKPVKKILEEKPKLLLHICCGPDATVPILDLKREYDITCYWYDPNIHPKKEYNKRLKAFKKVCKIEKIPFIEGEYDVENFFEKVKGFENEPERAKRCTECYSFRLDKTAQLANEMGIKYWTTSLNISPHKDVEKLFKIGEKLDKKYDLNFLKIAFRKNKGFERSVTYCKDNGIYRQNYCGCVYSETFPLLR